MGASGYGNESALIVEQEHNVQIQMSSPCGAKKGGHNSIQVMYLVTVAVGSGCISEAGPELALYQELLQAGLLLF